jgi:hypothetical protein
VAAEVPAVTEPLCQFVRREVIIFWLYGFAAGLSLGLFLWSVTLWL